MVLLVRSNTLNIKDLYSANKFFAKISLQVPVDRYLLLWDGFEARICREAETH